MFVRLGPSLARWFKFLVILGCLFIFISEEYGGYLARRDSGVSLKSCRPISFMGCCFLAGPLSGFSADIYVRVEHSGERRSGCSWHSRRGYSGSKMLSRVFLLGEASVPACNPSLSVVEAPGAFFVVGLSLQTRSQP